MNTLDNEEYQKLVELIKIELKNVKENGYINCITIKDGKAKFKHKSLRNHCFKIF